MKERTVQEQLRGFVDDLESSLDMDVGERFDCDDIILCGVGGSAVSGDFAMDCCARESVKRIRLMKYPDLPRWVGPRTLAIVSSYSGNTAETMEMYRQARERGCSIAVLTSGGSLKDLAEADGYRVFELPRGMQPRHAIGYMIGYTLRIIEAAGGPPLCGRIEGIVDALREYRDRVVTAGEADRLASRIMGRVPVICADGSMQSVAFRWKTQINENSKFVAFCEQSPGWLLGNPRIWSDGDPLTLVVLSADGDQACHGAAAMNAFARNAGDSGADVELIDLGGASTLENMFRAIILGDYISMRMAEIRGMDPAEVRPVMQMKAKLARIRDVSGSRR